MKIFITGRNGFIATNLRVRFKKDGHEIGSSSQGDDITSKLNDFKPDVICHLAMEGINADKMVESNILLTHKILEYCRNNTIQKLLIFGSSSEYGRKQHAITENDVLEPQTMYEGTKACATLLARAYAYTYKIPTVVIRPMSIYGPHEKDFKFMTRLFNKNIKYLNNANHDWTYIDDFVEGTVRIMNYSDTDIFDIVNIGLGVQRTNREVVQIVESLTGHKFEFIEDDSNGKVYDSMNWVCDPTHLKTKYGFEPKITLEEGISLHYDWFNKNIEFIVYLPHYDELCGGVNVLLYLAKKIDDEGYKCKVFMKDGNIRNQYYNRFATLDDVNDKTVAIYPETTFLTQYNPLNAKTIIRWILLAPKLSMYKNYSKSDIIYYHLPFAANHFPTQLLTVTMRPVDVIIQNTNSKRTNKYCFIIKKGRRTSTSVNGFKTPIHVNDSIHANNLLINSIPICLDDVSGFRSKDNTEIIKIFNTTKYFFCYDPMTFLVIMSVMCGCIVIQEPLNGVSESQWLHMIGCKERLYGIAYGIKNIDFAKKTIHLAYDQCVSLFNETDDNILRFINQVVNKEYKIEPCYKFSDDNTSIRHWD
jgi:nucleoside-diphosphate-sugar epimerase